MPKETKLEKSLRLTLESLKIVNGKIKMYI